ncbi:hypothetical protein DOM21_17900 [Bacteriovorax stolpii]|uniref:Uncharacterized protein n=1 Tax=Bacteriovorax stolpii TaxID=960 RepID=A0A2K9NPS8_BACTC|nr:hypothetical protein [Bacteriovorax stolpii]AUN96774.1 hypothetical protein C0V70_01375 [Bacteriovorax stolpii]QDK43295.1 hypothetical protein DOM21_17900 [Bacteriovorax stolpii]TDP53050.1 hypothetical protein C8D79_1691 [Bacteriovorax stolpii]
MKTLFIALLLSSSTLFAQDDIAGEGKNGNKKVIYTYKQYEKFDFDDLNIEGDTGAPSDISISPIHEKRFTNRLPYRKSFTMEIKKGIERVR